MIEKYTVRPDQTVKEVITYMDEAHIKAVAVTEDDMSFRGIFTAGDMRKFFIRSGEMTTPITEAMNRDPIIFHSIYEARQYPKRLIFYPILDGDDHLVNVIGDEISEETATVLKDVPVVIMAGGKGTRLYPYTKILPKALIPIGEQTITERIIDSFRAYGCNDFYMILNHKSGMIKAYFNEIDKDYNLTFVEEEEFLGTGGGLTYLKGLIKGTFFLSNCDILMDADIECIYRTHCKDHNVVTLVCAMMDTTIPYGVVQTNDNAELLSIKEKPEYSHLTNTGLYVLESRVIEELKTGEFIHMPDIALRYVSQGERVGVFPVSKQSWMDMGQFSEMESMKERLGV